VAVAACANAAVAVALSEIGSLVVGRARTNLAELHAAAAVGATVNDALLVAVTAALRSLLAGRGESVPGFRVAVVVAGRRPAEVAGLGNAASPLLVTRPATVGLRPTTDWSARWAASGAVATTPRWRRSFFALVQKSALDRERWATREELRPAIMTWIERT
jgi:hypothetical protein